MLFSGAAGAPVAGHTDALYSMPPAGTKRRDGAGTIGAEATVGRRPGPQALERNDDRDYHCSSIGRAACFYTQEGRVRPGDRDMLDHVTISVSDYQASKAFYRSALAPLGYSVIMEFDHAAGFGAKGKPEFWIRQGEPTRPPVHVAFKSPDRKRVDHFHAAAMEAGGRDNGAPGLRPEYHVNYYGAFVLDPDGNNVEAVCHESFSEGAV